MTRLSESELEKLIDNLAVTASMVGHGHARTKAQKSRLLTYASTLAQEAEHEEVVKAFTDKGVNPLYHDYQTRQLERQWPSLYFALARLASLTAEEGKK